MDFLLRLASAFDVGALNSVDADHIADFDKKWDGDDSTSFDGCWLAAALGSVTFDAWFGVGDLELHLDRHVEVYRFVFEKENLQFRAFFEEAGFVTDFFFGKGVLFK